MWFTDKIFGIESVIYKEYLKLSKRTKLIVLAKHVDNTNLDNMKIIEIPKTRKPLWKIRNIIAFSLKAIRARNEFDIVFIRMIGLHVLIPAIVSKLFLRKKFVMFISGSMQVIDKKENLFRRPIIKIATKMADSICTHSPVVIEDFEHHLGNKLETKNFIF